MRQYPTGTYTTGIVSADVDGDGDVDLITASRGSNKVTVLLNNGIGLFPTQEDYSTGIVPRYVSGGDFDGDGDFDLCTPDYIGMTTSVLMNDGTGAFALHEQYPMRTPSYLWVDDLDQDGFLDILTLHWDENADQPSQSPALFTPLFNDGSGNFSYGNSSWIGSQPRGGASADLNGDGILDVVTANYSSQSMSVLIGLGKRQWTDEIPIELSGNPRFVVLEDLDSDGAIDIAVIDKGEFHLWIYKNDGNASFTLIDSQDTSDIPHSISKGDIDQDGDIDLVVTHVGSSYQRIYFNNGKGIFSTNQVFVATGGPADVILDDLNADGFLDIATANVNWSNRGASVFLQGNCEGPDCNSNGIGDICEMPDCNINGTPDECDIAEGFSTDKNGDGIPDECQSDCNSNGIPDLYEIETGLATDCDENGIPDDCDWPNAGDCDDDGVIDGCEIDVNYDWVPDDCQCIADFTGDGRVAVHDLLSLIAVWGETPSPHEDPMPEDLNIDFEIDILDMLLLIGAWGDCPDTVVSEVDGACCVNAGICFQENEVACGVRYGVYYGDNVSCESVECQTP